MNSQVIWLTSTKVRKIEWRALRVATFSDILPVETLRSSGPSSMRYFCYNFSCLCKGVQGHRRTSSLRKSGS